MRHKLELITRFHGGTSDTVWDKFILLNEYDPTNQYTIIYESVGWWVIYKIV